MRNITLKFRTDPAKDLVIADRFLNGDEPLSSVAWEKNGVWPLSGFMTPVQTAEFAAAALSLGWTLRNGFEPKTLVDRLRIVRAFLTPPERWAQGWLAKDAQGHTTPAKSKNACSFCLAGAMVKLWDSDIMCEMAKSIQGEVGTYIVELNDNAESHEDFLAKLDHLIERLRHDEPVQGGER